MRTFLRLLDCGLNPATAIEKTCGLHPCEGKDRARIRLDGITLTLPVEGGAKRLADPALDPILSGHGKWPREHLGALEALYGSAPYYEHMRPWTDTLYENPVGTRLSGFAHYILVMAMECVDTTAPLPQRVSTAAAEIRAGINPGLSILDPIFRLGRTCTLAWGHDAEI